MKKIAVNAHEQAKSNEVEIKRLEEENQSLETVRKIQEKDAENEKAELESLVKKISVFYFLLLQTVI